MLLSNTVFRIFEKIYGDQLIESMNCFNRLVQFKSWRSRNIAQHFEFTVYCTILPIVYANFSAIRILKGYGDFRRLRELAEIGGGTFYEAVEEIELTNTFVEIGACVDAKVGVKSPIELSSSTTYNLTEYKQYTDCIYGPLEVTPSTSNNFTEYKLDTKTTDCIYDDYGPLEVTPSTSNNFTEYG